MAPHKGLGDQGPRDPGARGPRDPDTLCHKLVSSTTRGVQMTTKSKSKSDLDVRSGGGGPVGEKVAPVRAAMWDPRSPKGLGTHEPRDPDILCHRLVSWTTRAEQRTH